MADAAAEQGPIINVAGERVGLGPLDRALLPTMVWWGNDFAVGELAGFGARPVTKDAVEAIFEPAFKGDPREAHFAVYQLAGRRPIGNAGLRDVDHRRRTAEFGILIGERDFWGKGCGTEATRLVLDYAFTALGLNSVGLDVAEYNSAGKRGYEKAGFREVGRRRQLSWFAGRLWDMIIMDCLVSEFTSPILASVFVPDQVRAAIKGE